MKLIPRAVPIALLALALSSCGLAAPRALQPLPEPTALPSAGQAGALHGVAASLPTPAPTQPPPAPTQPPPAPTQPPPAPTQPPPAPTQPPPAPTPPPPARSAPARLIIGSIQLDRELVSVGLDASNTPVVPDYDVAWYNLSATPGEGENVVVWGHALRFSAAPHVPAPLERVREARVGDLITLITADGVAHPYVIAEQIWATPDQVQFILPTGDERLTIVNCIGDYVVDATGAIVSMTHRLITIARPA